MDDLKQLYYTLSDATTAATTAPIDPTLNGLLPLCETLFEQLRTDFRRFFYSLPLRDDVTVSLSFPPPHPQLWSIVEDLSLVLRCSLVVLTLLPLSDQKFLIDKCRFLLRVLKSFLSVDTFSVLRFHNFFTDADLELSDSCRPFLCAVLEVFADELLRHQSLRRYLMIAGSAPSSSEKLFVCHFNHDDIGIVMEVISTHFILSVSKEKAFENFISRLFIHCDEGFRFPGLCLASSTVLLLDPVLLTAPKMFQAHIISLVSEVIGSGLSSGYSAPDMNCHLIAFQKSVLLYSMHMSSLQVDCFYAQFNSAYNLYQLERGQPTLESYIRQDTNNRLNQVSSKSDWDSSRCKLSSETKADLLAEYIAFMNERQYIFADSCRDMTAPILDCIVRRAFSPDATGDVLSNIKEKTSTQDIFLLASILKLMTVSLLQAIKCLSNSCDSGCLKTMGSDALLEKYLFLISIVKHFQQFKFYLPIQTFLYNVTKSQPTNHKESKSMLVHFSGLLSLCFYNGLDLLAKGCVSVIMALMYLFVFEEGDLAALGSLNGHPLQPCSSEIPSVKNVECAGDKQSIYKLAAEFHRIRSHNLRSDLTTPYNIEEERSEETSNGEMFLNCMIGDPKKLSDYAELADFIECKTGKNYSSWLNRRQIYRKWRYQKISVLRKIKKETNWKYLKAQKNVKCLKRQKIGKLLKRWT